mmetsp:Transcript_82196/g.180701  ORF Transcript_82196/g.180701 Transcript_82196/m.180701 type:complete len:225 (+) Transcript_82196:571-1245(+)
MVATLLLTVCCKFLFQGFVPFLHLLKLSLGFFRPTILVRVHFPCQLPVSIVNVLLGGISCQAKVGEVEVLAQLFELRKALVVKSRPFQQSLANFMHKTSELVSSHIFRPFRGLVFDTVCQGVDGLFPEDACGAIFVLDDCLTGARSIIQLSYDGWPSPLVVGNGLAFRHAPLLVDLSCRRRWCAASLCWRYCRCCSCCRRPRWCQAGTRIFAFLLVAMSQSGIH